MTRAPDWDVFICHASEDKESAVEPLLRALEARGVRVWYDRMTLTIGDSLRRKIDEGLAKSRFGIVVLSQAFFQKEWPQIELDGLVQKEIGGKKVILPVWHGVNREDVERYSPSLAGRLAGSTRNGIPSLTEELLRSMALELTPGAVTGSAEPSPSARPAPTPSQGSIALSGVEFQTDPTSYTGPQVIRRASSFPVIGGGVVVQDFGAAPSDSLLTLKSGPAKLPTETMRRLQSLFMAGGAHTITDWLENEFTVFIKSFSPRPVDSARWDYEMKLIVTKVMKLNGSPVPER